VTFFQQPRERAGHASAIEDNHSMNTTVNTTVPAQNAKTTPSIREGEQRLDRPEPRLLVALRRQASRNGHSQVELAQHLGVTSGYLMQLRSGTRDVSRISLDFARACASYLDTSTLNVLLLSGSIDVSDFSAPGNPERRIRKGLQALLEDPAYAGFIDEPLLRALPADAQQLLVSLYEEATQQDFGVSRILPPMTWSSLRLATSLAAEEVRESERDGHDTLL